MTIALATRSRGVELARTILVFAILVTVFALARAPAALVRHLVPDDIDLELIEPIGTIWNGSADLLVAGQPAGRLDWRFLPKNIFNLSIGYELSISTSGAALAGSAAATTGGFAIDAAGELDAAYVNRWLSAYDILLTGRFSLEHFAMNVPWGAASTEDGTEHVRDFRSTSAGQLRFSGGPVRYRLGGIEHASRLPALEARVGPQQEARIAPANQPEAILIEAKLAAGNLVLGLTRQFTAMLGQRWPGEGVDHEVVMEVELPLLKQSGAR